MLLAPFTSEQRAEQRQMVEVGEAWVPCEDGWPVADG